MKHFFLKYVFYFQRFCLKYILALLLAWNSSENLSSTYDYAIFPKCTITFLEEFNNCLFNTQNWIRLHFNGNKRKNFQRAVA